MNIHGKNILTFVLAGGKGSRLYPLTRDRSKPAVPFAARFRIIDYVLSSCINSGLRHIYVLTQFKSLSLESHLRLGWNFLANELGEFVTAVPAQQRISEAWYSGTADAIFQNLHLLEDHRPEHVFILSGDHIYNMDFNEMYDQHIKSGADLTLSVMPIKKKEAHEFGVLTTDENGSVTSFIEKPQDPSTIPGEGDDCFINMGVYLFKTDSLVRELAADAREKTDHDFGKNIIPNMLSKMKVQSFDFTASKFGDYWKDVGTIRSYYDANMDYLKKVHAQSNKAETWPLRTLGEQLPSAYLGGAEIRVSNSTIGSASRITDSTIKNSLIGRNVTIGEGCDIQDSIVCSGVKIGKNCKIKNTIIDHRAKISDDKTIGYNLEEDKKNLFIADGLVILPKQFEY
ncbi:MAG: glucose-1-phosphate adenylyltransferase [SAR324 cluster bacterium]|nr:glucose-1-phosphate adenylyltransferase [SAR324 cluster bacterium]